MKSRFRTKSINSINDITEDTKFIVFLDYSYSAMGADYGPPDPPPTMETHNSVQLLAFYSDEELKSWIELNSKKNFKVIQYQPLLFTISTEIKFS